MSPAEMYRTVHQSPYNSSPYSAAYDVTISPAMEMYGNPQLPGGVSHMSYDFMSTPYSTTAANVVVDSRTTDKVMMNDILLTEEDENPSFTHGPPSGLSELTDVDMVYPCKCGLRQQEQSKHKGKGEGDEKQAKKELVPSDPEPVQKETKSTTVETIGVCSIDPIDIKCIPPVVIEPDASDIAPETVPTSPTEIIQSNSLRRVTNRIRDILIG